MGQLKNMGSLESIAAMMPGMNSAALKDAKVDEKAMAHMEAIILSMTPAEREKPEILNSSRKNVLLWVRERRWKKSTACLNNMNRSAS